MDLNELKKLVAQGEGQHLEFKKKANHPEKIIREIVAFANTSGGLLVLGVDDDGTLSGTRDIDGEVFVVNEAIQKWIRPHLSYQVDVIQLNAKKGVAIFEIAEGQNKPYAVKSSQEGGKRMTYVRKLDESLQASREMREIIRRRQKNADISFEYGDKEKVLMEYLESYGEIDIDRFRKLAKISKYMACRTLVRLVLANVLEITPTGTGDLYSMKLEVI